MTPAARLAHLAARTRHMPDLLGSVLLRVDGHELCHRLGCRRADLPRLCLCRLPRAAAERAAVEAAFGLRPGALATVLD